jgi:hypothetical protein
MGDLREAFDRSVKSNAQVAPEVDDALVEAGRKIADRVDEATALGDGQEVTKALYLLPHLMNVLREMYATPKARIEGGIGKEEAGGKLAEVRQLRNRPAPTKKAADAG